MRIKTEWKRLLPILLAVSLLLCGCGAAGAETDGQTSQSEDHAALDTGCGGNVEQRKRQLESLYKSYEVIADCLWQLYEDGILTEGEGVRFEELQNPYISSGNELLRQRVKEGPALELADAAPVFRNYKGMRAFVFEKFVLFEWGREDHLHFAYSATAQPPEDTAFAQWPGRVATYHHAFGNWYICEMNAR